MHVMSGGGMSALPETGVWLDDLPVPDLGSLLQEEELLAQVPPLCGTALQLGVPAATQVAPPAAALDFAAVAVALRTSSCDSKQPGSPTTTDSLKREHVRAQNRAKSRRHRQREKATREQLEQQCQAAAEELERARAEHERLDLAVRVKDALQRQLADAEQVLQAAAAADPGGRKALQDQDAAESIASLARQLSALTFQQRVDLCGSLFRATAPALEAVEQQGARDGDSVRDVYSLDWGVQQTVGHEMAAAHPYLLEGVLGMSREVLDKDWVDFCQFFFELTEQLDSGAIGEAEAEQRMRPASFFMILREVLFLMHRPKAILPLLMRFKLPGESEQDATARWRQAAVDMRITREQALQLRPSYLHYQEQLRQLRSRTEASLEILASVRQGLSQKLLQLDGGLGAQSAQYLRLMEAAGQLQSVERGEEVFLLFDYYAIAGRYVTELQKLRLMAACRPNLSPDVPSVVREALRMHGLLGDGGEQQGGPTPASALAGPADGAVPTPLVERDGPALPVAAGPQLEGAAGPAAVAAAPTGGPPA